MIDECIQTVNCLHGYPVNSAATDVLVLEPTKYQLHWTSFMQNYYIGGERLQKLALMFENNGIV